MKLKTKVSDQGGKAVININSNGVTGTLSVPGMAVGQVVEVIVAELVEEGAGERGTGGEVSSEQ